MSMPMLKDPRLDTAPDASESLVELCKRGDWSAWRALYLAQFEFVRNSAKNLGTPPAELDDVAHDVFAIALKRVHLFREGQLATWLYRICANVVTARHRRRRVRKALWSLFGPAADPEARVASGPTPERRLQQVQAERQVAQILEQMKPKKREVLVLYEIEGLTGDEIAERVGCPVDTVWSRLFHARQEFRRIGERLGLLEIP